MRVIDGEHFLRDSLHFSQVCIIFPEVKGCQDFATFHSRVLDVSKAIKRHLYLKILQITIECNLLRFKLQTLFHNFTSSVGATSAALNELSSYTRYVIFALISGQTSVSLVNCVGVFFCVGIAMDQIFVFTDAWTLSASREVAMSFCERIVPYRAKVEMLSHVTVLI